MMPGIGVRASEALTHFLGSWRGLAVQSGLLLCYITLNSWILADPFDRYPFIALNLLLSFQAAYTGPIVLMSQNRADAKRDATLELIAEQNRLLLILVQREQTEIEALIERS